MATLDALDLAIADLAAGRAPDPEAGRRIAELARAMVGTDAGAAMLKRRALAERDRLLFEMAGKYATHLESTRAKAALLDKIARRYQAGRWRFHRGRLRLPEELRGQPERYVWLVLKANGDFPGYEKIRKLL